jgi:hypothetical protein
MPSMRLFKGARPIHRVISTINVMAISLAALFDPSNTGGREEIISLTGNGRTPNRPMPSRIMLKHVGGIFGYGNHEGEGMGGCENLFISKFGPKNIGTSGWIINFNQFQNNCLSSAMTKVKVISRRRSWIMIITFVDWKPYWHSKLYQ